MKLPDPTAGAGLVIRFDYTWYKDHFKKQLPCAIVLASSQTGMVTVVPITHSYPDIGEEDQSLQVPEDVCKAMGLEGINYVRLSEVNRFEWPSDRIKPLPNDPSRCGYGNVPKDFFLEIRKRLAEAVRAGRLNTSKV
ncbi:hypothetical protein QO004_001858 [Rhizobium mesoamericanum]|nr:hypothetical protein [Rhizobium mesoamericanum]